MAKNDPEIAKRESESARRERGYLDSEKTAMDIERAERYRQSIAGNPDYCTWPTYSDSTDV